MPTDDGKMPGGVWLVIIIVIGIALLPVILTVCQST